MYFTFTDYNADVLRLVTLPNILLLWCSTLSQSQSEQLFGAEGNPLHFENGSATTAQHSGNAKEEEEGSGDLYITPSLLTSFTSSLAQLGISLTFLSGSWTPTAALLPLIPSSPDLNTFILGSETIYSPVSLAAFTEAIVALMSRVKTGKTVVAAKRVYFGVGGSVDGFREECSKRGCVAYEVEFEGLESDGVRRCLVEVQMY